MAKVVAFIVSKKFDINLDSVRLMAKAPQVSDIVIFGNGLSLENKHNLNFDKVTIMSSDIELSLSRVYRSIIAFTHQIHSEGDLYILRGSDSIQSRSFLNIEAPRVLTLDDEWEPDNSVHGFEDLFNMRYPLGFIPVLDIAELKYALKSRNSAMFMTYFMKGECVKCDSIHMYSPEAAIQCEEVLPKLISSDIFTNKVIKRILAYSITKENDKSDSIQDE